MTRNDKWLCKNCGETMGFVCKSEEGFTAMRPVVVCGELASWSRIIIYGDAKIYCIKCGLPQKWYWNEHALKRVLRYRERRV